MSADGWHRTVSLVLILSAAFLAGFGIAGLAAGDVRAGVPYLLAAAACVVALLLARLNWRLVEVDRILVGRIVRLHRELAAQRASLPPR